MSIAALLLAVLPGRIDPPAPFPHIVSEAPTISAIAPGIESAQYDLVTDAGPIVVRVVAIASHRSDVHIGSVVANDTLTGKGETVSSMASRTGAVAGINADYFDIGNTNAPTNIVVRDGQLLRTPRKRYALVTLDDGSSQIVENSFLGQVQLADRTVSLDAINEFPPPNGGVTLMTPWFGPVPPLENLTLVALTPNGGTPPLTQYTVSGVADNMTRQPPGYYLVIGLNAYAKAGVPNTGDRIAINGDLSPLPLASISAAVGGGPLLVDNGNAVDDPDGPNGGEFAQRIPSSGTALTSDGTVLLVEVDGRQPEESVGVTRPEFAALMRAFDATRGMAFDGGGSSTLVERIEGTPATTVVNSPSDGKERPIADAIFAYSTAPTGPPSRIVGNPSHPRALVGTRFQPNLVAVDDAGHVVPTTEPIVATVEPTSLGELRNGIFTALRAGKGAIVARSGAITGSIPIEISDDPARLTVLPEHPFVERNGTLRLVARAYDAGGYPIALPPELPWRATGAQIDNKGTLSAGSTNAIVSLLVGDRLADVAVTVGSHDVPFPFPNDAHFMSIPRGGDGDVTHPSDCPVCLALRYRLGPDERAAYAIMPLALPNQSVGIAFDLLDDGSGANVRVALRNAINEELLVPATVLDHPGWRRVVVRLAQTLVQPARLTGIYVIGKNAAAASSGTVVLKDLTIVVAGQK